MILEGRVWRYAQQLRAVDLVPSRYDFIKLTDWTEAASHVLEDLDPEFRSRVQKGDIIVGGRAFGSGHAHYFQQAFEGAKWLGVGGFLGESFDPIFIISAIGAGMPCWSLPGILDFVGHGDRIRADMSTGVIQNETAGTKSQYRPISKEVIEILDAGGLDALTINRLNANIRA